MLRSYSSEKSCPSKIRTQAWRPEYERKPSLMYKWSWLDAHAKPNAFYTRLIVKLASFGFHRILHQACALLTPMFRASNMASNFSWVMHSNEKTISRRALTGTILYRFFYSQSNKYKFICAKFTLSTWNCHRAKTYNFKLLTVTFQVKWICIAFFICFISRIVLGVSSNTLE